MKRLKSLLLALSLIALFSTCSEQSDCCINMALNIDVELQDASGADLLNSSTAGFIPKDDIQVFYEINGKLETYLTINKGAIMDRPEGFDIYSDGTRYYLHVFSNPTPGKDVVTLIKIKYRDEIRLLTNVEENNGKQITELRYNDQLVWANTMSSRQSPRVTVKFD